MTPERYQRISELFHTALEFEGEQRAAFLDQACAGDDGLRREVESLIASHEQAADFIDMPAFKVTAQVLAEDEANALNGQTIGRYRILSLLGSGGMGQVYLATDTELGRRVALKFLPEYFTHDKNQAQRFRQEARAASALNHPNILTVYEVGQVDGREFIAMEFIDGETLREKIHRDKTPLPELLKYLNQTAEGLAKAHAAGIVHRDLKPDNIMITSDGYAKILDFGLAKLIEGQRGPGSRQHSSEIATAIMSQHSLPGTVMGTAGYMSPEQAQGRVREIDHRSDIFSFGCILFEAATGHKAFPLCGCPRLVA